MTPIDASEFTCIEAGRTYQLPTYKVVAEGLVKCEEYLPLENQMNHLEIKFCKGSKDNTDIPKQDGILTETLVAMLIHQLQTVNVEVPSRETSVAITKFEEGLMWLQKRSADRAKRGVQQTYQK